MKAGVVTLSKILSAKDTSMHRELQSHFGSLIREFSEMSLIKEASLITQWWSETQRGGVLRNTGFSITPRADLSPKTAKRLATPQGRHSPKG